MKLQLIDNVKILYFFFTHIRMQTLQIKNQKEYILLYSLHKQMHKKIQETRINSSIKFYFNNV